MSHELADIFRKTNLELFREQAKAGQDGKTAMWTDNAEAGVSKGTLPTLPKYEDKPAHVIMDGNEVASQALGLAGLMATLAQDKMSVVTQARKASLYSVLAQKAPQAVLARHNLLKTASMATLYGGALPSQTGLLIDVMCPRSNLFKLAPMITSEQTRLQVPTRIYNDLHTWRTLDVSEALRLQIESKEADLNQLLDGMARGSSGRTNNSTIACARIKLTLISTQLIP